MPVITQIALIIILILTCILVSFSTDHNARTIRKQISASQIRLEQMEGKKSSNPNEVAEIQKSLKKLEKELSKLSQISWFPSLPKSESLYEKLRSSLPLVIGIVVGMMLGAVVIVFIPIIFIVILFTIATYMGSFGLFSEFVRNEKRALALSLIPAGLYAMTQVFVLLEQYDLFDLVFWLFDIVVVLTLVGVSMIIGKELQLEIVIIIVTILTAWDIYAVLFSNIMGTAILNLSYTLFSVLIPTGAGYALLGGGDFFFSFLLVSAFTRRLKKIPVALIVMIGASVTGLIVVMAIIGQSMAPALPAVLAAGLISTLYYRKQLRKRAN